MTTFYKGPLVVFGGNYPNVGASIAAPSTYNGIENDNLGPSVFLRGTATLDPRFGPYGGANTNQIVLCWYGTDYLTVCNAVPATASTTNLAAAQVPGAGTAM